MSNPAIERFVAKISLTDDCWLWTASRNHNGYGQFKLAGRRGKMVKAHRFSYEWFVGHIPAGLTIDHLCRVRHCVNFEHMEAVTMRENTLRGDTIPARNATKTHCLRGHEFTPANTYSCAGGQRACRTCQNARQRHYRLVATNRS